jgi:hypothetical protein
MKTLEIINTFNLKSDVFINLLLSKDYYIFLKENDDQLLDFNFEYFNNDDDEINLKVNINYKSIIPDYVSKFIGSYLNENVTETITYDKKNKTCKTKINCSSLNKLSTTIEYKFELIDNEKSCNQIITYSFSSSMPFISSFIERTVENRLKTKSKFLYDLQTKFVNKN